MSTCRRCTRFIDVVLVAVVFVVSSAFSTSRAAWSGAAHPSGTLHVGTRTPRAGDSLLVTGTKFEPRDEVTLVLVGTAGRLQLGAVPTDSTGAFRRTLLVPASAAPGAWRLVAEAIDGDEAASLDLTVQAPPAAGAPGGHVMPGGMSMGPEGMSAGSMPTGAPLELIRARRPVVTSLFVVLILACGAVGVSLFRTPRAYQENRT